MGAVAALSASAQMHKVAKPEKVVRAVGVYEWTGELGHPTASRLIPVSLFIDGSLEDAGVYLARPVPFALGSGTEYELDAAGLAKGDLALETAARVQTPDDAYTDGWIGYGGFRAPVEAVARKTPGKGGPGRLSGTISVADAGDGKPHAGSRSDDAAKGKDSGMGAGASDGKTADSGADADRPTMRRRADAGSGEETASSGTGSGGSGSDTAGADPADRPTLKRRTPEAAADAKKEKKKKEQTASVTGVGSLNDDPDRPTLHRGSAGGAEGADRDVPKLMGLPPDMHQMVAVSDAATREAHPFARAWGGEDERLAVLETMRGMAAAQLAAYAAKGGAMNPKSSAGSPAAGSGAATGSGAVPRLRAGAGSGVKSRLRGASAAAPAMVEEDLRGFQLSYGGAPTYVYTAHTAGGGEAMRYVAVVAQAGAGGELQQAMASVTDAGHLDRTPWLRLVDAVDAEASNRASLLFELRGKEARQFALYRVLGGRSDQLFATGTTE